MSSKKSREGPNQAVYIKNNNVLWGSFELMNLPTMSFDESERRRFSLREGDLIVCEGGEIGRAAVWRDIGREVHYQKALHRLRPRTKDYSSRFLCHYLRYCAAAGILYRIATGTTILHLPRERLAGLRLPFPDTASQESIATALESLSQAADGVGLRFNALQAVKQRLFLDALAS